MSAATETSMTEQTRENIGKAIGRIASGVYIVTLGDGSARDGMLATWICQAAFEPPMVVVAVKKEREILPKMAIGQRFVVNVLSKKNMDIFKNFAKPYTEGLDRFAELSVEQNEFGPAFSAAVAYMNCKVVSHTETGDHILVAAEVHGGAVQNPDEEPMTHLRKSGFQY